MTRRHRESQLAARHEIVAPPAHPNPRACDDRTFELPPGLHMATAGLFTSFVTILCATFATRGLAVPYAVFVFFIAAFFLVPALWARMKPHENLSRALRWDELMSCGITTATGRVSGKDAAILVLILPTFVTFWALAIATIVTFAR